MKTLNEVLSLFNIESDINNEVRGITSDSRKVEEGFIFIVLKGIHYNGKDFIKEALNKGAVAVFNEEIQDDNIYRIEKLKEKFRIINSPWNRNGCSTIIRK